MPARKKSPKSKIRHDSTKAPKVANSKKKQTMFGLKIKKTIPFDFVLESLAHLSPSIKPMFGCHAIYLGLKIMLILRDKEDHTFDNGVWICTQPEHHESLKIDFPIMRSLKLFDSKKPTSWQNIPSSHQDFDFLVTKLCDLIQRQDPRIGKIPAKKNGKTK